MQKFERENLSLEINFWNRLPFSVGKYYSVKCSHVQAAQPFKLKINNKPVVNSFINLYYNIIPGNLAGVLSN
jgi:hypothetical protein